MTVVFVTAIYNIHPTRSSEIWSRFKEMTAILPIHLICSKDSASSDLIPSNVTIHIREFEELNTFKTLNPILSLPTSRNTFKDTRDYLLLMNAKTEFLQIVKEDVTADHYIWIDAGISKIFTTPSKIFSEILEGTKKPLKDNKILLPGCWSTPISCVSQLTNRITWRFAGGFFVVPSALVDKFARITLEGCICLNSLTWEVNVWAFIEEKLPIQWEKADHNDSIISGLKNFTRI